MVIILGCYDWQKDIVLKELQRHDPSLSPPVEINAEVPSDQRVKLYQSLQCCFVTTRILVVDLLCGRLASSSVAGIIVVNAHRVTESSGEAFAVRLYREGHAVKGPQQASSTTNPHSLGFIRAISDMPTHFAFGFNKVTDLSCHPLIFPDPLSSPPLNKVEKTMKALGLKKLSLWPRFQQYVLDELDATPPQVVEWEQDLTPAMIQIQASIIELMDMLIKELKKTNCIDWLVIFFFSLSLSLLPFLSNYFTSSYPYGTDNQSLSLFLSQFRNQARKRHLSLL